MLTYFLFFILVHTVMVYITGLLVNLNHITTGMNAPLWAGLWLYVIWMAIVMVVWFAASPLTLRYPRLVQKTGRFLVGRAKFSWNGPLTRRTPNGRSPPSSGPIKASYRLANCTRAFVMTAFATTPCVSMDWSQNPVTLSYDHLKAMSKQEQITQHYCIQGWSGIAKWGGVPMRHLLDRAAPAAGTLGCLLLLRARCRGGALLRCAQHQHMQHHETLLAYEMNGEPLNELHGAPLRLRNELELGFKQVKWIEAIEFVEKLSHLGAGQGGYNEDHEFYGYRMPI